MGKIIAEKPWERWFNRKVMGVKVTQEIVDPKRWKRFWYSYAFVYGGLFLTLLLLYFACLLTQL